MSLPVRERGLKWTIEKIIVAGMLVAPCAGAWVEISDDYIHRGKD